MTGIVARASCRSSRVGRRGSSHGAITTRSRVIRARNPRSKAINILVCNPSLLDNVKLIIPNSFINPDYGWDTLSITPSSMQKLLYHLGVFYQLFKYLRAFGTKTFALDEGFGGFDFSIDKDGDEAGQLKGIGSFSF